MLCLDEFIREDFSVAFDEVDRLIQCNYPPRAEEEEYFPDAEEFTRICVMLDDRDRWLAEADRNGWPLEYIKRAER